MKRVGSMSNKKNQPETLSRELQSRHIQLIAIGGAIGVGLFLGSASAIKTAGPAILINYIVAGLIIFLIMRALGELVLYKPVSGSFSTYASEFIGEWAGFFTGWTYWFMWVVIGMAEITAVGKYVNLWFPRIDNWIPALISLVFIYLINMIAVKVFGEVEFWFALIKVVTIILLILVGLLIIFTGIGNHGQATGFSNLWSHGGFFPEGFSGMLLSLQMVMFAFIGVELIGVTAGEAKDPDTTIPKAVDSVIWRILIFYVGSLTVILAIYPWIRLDENVSPFVLTFEKVGIPGAAMIINFVVLTAALSSCNSGVFSSGRMLFNLSQLKQAPKGFQTVNHRSIPAKAITISTFFLLIGVALNYFIPEKAFAYITSIGTVGAVWTWMIIMFAHLQYHKKVKAGKIKRSHFQMPGAPFTNWIVIIFLAAVIVLLAFDAETRIALIVGPIWFIILAIGYQVVKRKKDTN
jgi:AAT family amino acid transporter/D-serine/D-alanine/glycine transporter